MYKALKSAKIRAELATAAVKALESHIARNLDGEMDKILAKFDAINARLDAQKNHFTILGIMIALASIIISASNIIG